MPCDSVARFSVTELYSSSLCSIGLGVLAGHNLSRGQQCSAVANKADAVLGCIRKILQYMGSDSTTLIHVSFDILCPVLSTVF